MLLYIHLRNYKQENRNKMNPQIHCSEIVIATILAVAFSLSFSIFPDMCIYVLLCIIN